MKTITIAILIIVPCLVAGLVRFSQELRYFGEAKLVRSIRASFNFMRKGVSPFISRQMAKELLDAISAVSPELKAAQRGC